MSNFDEIENNVYWERKYKLPNLQTILPVNENQFFYCNDMADWIQWLEVPSCIPKRRFYDKIANPVYFTAVFHPFTKDKKRYEELSKLMIMFFIIDDHMETQSQNLELDQTTPKEISAQFNQMLNKLSRDKFVDMSGWTPYITAAFAIFEAICSKFNKVQKERFVKVWRDYKDGNIEEQKAVENNYKLKSFDELIKLRMNSVGLLPVIQLIEYADDVYVPENEWLHPKVQELFDWCTKVVIMTNDFYSFEKEMIENRGKEEKMFNTVFVISNLENVDYYGAMVKVARLIGEAEQRMLDLENELLGFGCLSESTKIMIKYTKYIAGGNWKGCSTLKRYNKFVEID